jgi:hypothetical protein
MYNNEAYKKGNLYINNTDYEINHDLIYISIMEPVQVVIICGDSPKVGDKVLAGNNIVEVSKESEIIFAEEFPKILIQSNQISPEIIQLLIDKKLNDWDQVEVEAEEVCCGMQSDENNSCGDCNNSIERVKLKNGFAIIHPVESKLDKANKISNGFSSSKESVEEAAKEYSKYKLNTLSLAIRYTNDIEDTFIAGAKWQKKQDKLYTEEEVIEMKEMLLRLRNHCKIHGFPSKSFQQKLGKWWNKHKK